MQILSAMCAYLFLLFCVLFFHKYYHSIIRHTELLWLNRTDRCSALCNQSCKLYCLILYCVSAVNHLILI